MMFLNWLRRFRREHADGVRQFQEMQAALRPVAERTVQPGGVTAQRRPAAAPAVPAAQSEAKAA